MKHFSTEQWINFVNQVLTASETESMKQHLQQGCKRCAATVSLWQKFQRAAASEAHYLPPADAVRVVKAAFAGAGLTRQRNKVRGGITVLFDSLLQPVFAGARSAGTGTRQMLYRAEPFQIDVQIEAQSAGNRLLVTGQLLDLKDAAITCHGVRVILSNMRGNLAHVVTNEFGEFSGEIENSGDLQLTFTGAGDKPVVISLRDALGQVSKWKQ